MIDRPHIEDNDNTELEDEDLFEDKRFDFRNQLRLWSISHNITQSVINDLLEIVDIKYLN